jgi:hypothetical protein
MKRKRVSARKKKKKKKMKWHPWGTRRQLDPWGTIKSGTGERWSLFFNCEGAEPNKEFIEIVLDRASISLF